MISTLRINEIFFSIQGESTWAGLPCVFIRLTGCHLRCAYCDTEYAFFEGKKRTLDEIIAEADRIAPGAALYEITGGEPLLQPNVQELMRRLCDAGKTVLIETSGERDIADIDPRVHRIVDLKAPGSGESAKNRWENLALLTQQDELKIVLADRADYEWAREVILRERLHERVGEVLLSCVHGVLDPQQLVAWVLEDELPVRVQLQLHKYIWSPSTTGV